MSQPDPGRERMGNAHDRGGWPTDEPIDRTEHPTMDWELEAYGLVITLLKRGIFRPGETRVPMERMTRSEYESLGYYERWSSSVETLLVEKGILTREEIDRKVAVMERTERQA